MEIVNMEAKSFELIRTKMVELAERMRVIYKLKQDKEKWLDNQDVCLLLDISLRTLQSYRNKGILSYSQIGYKCYYKTADVESFIQKAKSNPKNKLI